MALLSRLLLLAAVVPFAFATSNSGNSKSCSNADFYFDQADCCVPQGGQKNPPPPPSGTQCPSNGWDWHSGKSCCVPHQPSPPAPTCNKGWTWNSSTLKCTPTPPPPPPAPPAPPKPSPPSSGNDCKNTEFFFGRKQCCLPRGGQPSPPSPPSGTQCPPSGWSWHSGKGCCVPHNPPDNQPPPQCNKGWDWDDNDLKCCPHSTPTPPPNPPKPSNKPYHKRVLKARTASLCPKGLEACPVPGFGGASGDIECLDTSLELTSCGGCSSTGAGQDCSALEGVWNVGCYRGSCQVYTCAQGYKRSLNGHSCIKL